MKDDKQNLIWESQIKETNKIEELILEKTCRLQKSTKDSGQTFSTMFLMITL